MMGRPRPADVRLTQTRPNYLPLLSPLLATRWTGISVAIVSLLQFSLAHMGFGGLACPIRHFTGVPCPGCGLTTASWDLFHGEWADGLAQHAFAPLFLVLGAVVLVSAFLPRAQQLAWSQWVADREERTGAFQWFLAALVIYWAVRLAIR